MDSGRLINMVINAYPNELSTTTKLLLSHDTPVLFSGEVKMLRSTRAKLSNHINSAKLPALSTRMNASLSAPILTNTQVITNCSTGYASSTATKI